VQNGNKALFVIALRKIIIEILVKKLKSDVSLNQNPDTPLNKSIKINKIIKTSPIRLLTTVINAERLDL
jgi:hypothetical protein